MLFKLNLSHEFLSSITKKKLNRCQWPRKLTDILRICSQAAVIYDMVRHAVWYIEMHVQYDARSRHARNVLPLFNSKCIVTSYDEEESDWPIRELVTFFSDTASLSNGNNVEQNLLPTVNAVLRNMSLAHTCISLLHALCSFSFENNLCLSNELHYRLCLSTL